MPGPERILVVRSGRHLDVAIEALRVRFPDCRIGVLATPGSGPVIEAAGVSGADTFIYEAARFDVLPFMWSRVFRAVRRWRCDRVAVLWSDCEGRGHHNVNRTALALRARFLAITPDGRIVERTALAQARTEIVRFVASVAVAATLGVLLYLPAAIVGLFRRAVKERPRATFSD